MGAFSGLKDASRGYSSNPLQKGKYVVRIDGCEFFRARTKGEMWKNTLTILAIDDGDAHRVGEQVHVFFKVGTNLQMFQQNLKGFLAGVLGADDSEVTEAVADEALGENSPMVGLVTVVTVREQVHRTAKNEDGTPVRYTLPSWSRFLSPEQIQDAIGAEGVARFFPQGFGG